MKYITLYILIKNMNNINTQNQNIFIHDISRVHSFMS